MLIFFKCPFIIVFTKQILLYLFFTTFLPFIGNLSFKGLFSQKIWFFQNNKLSNLKVCICTLGKDENRYITEFVEHSKNYGVDKIYLYDNNDIDGERFENIIGKYVNNKFVEVIDWRGVKGTKTYYGIMDSCYQTYYDKYDWLIFYELTFLNLKVFFAKND